MKYCKFGNTLWITNENKIKELGAKSPNKLLALPVDGSLEGSKIPLLGSALTIPFLSSLSQVLADLIKGMDFTQSSGLTAATP